MNINKDTKIYGSFSDNPGNNGCIFFNSEFEKHEINAIYKSFYSTNAMELIVSVKHLNFSGFALSMPLKISIMNYLDEIEEGAKNIGAVNTVVNKEGKLVGYNTDWIGVKEYIINYLPSSINFMTILGNGGFSKAVQYACDNLNIKYKIITRNNWELAELRGIVFNATPVDVKPLINEFLKEYPTCYLIDGRPFTETGKIIANFQAKEQFFLYTGTKII
jgi:shikimate dehydrogenase